MRDIEPRFDTVVCFWSDGRTPHEVLPSHRKRYAVSVWYHIADGARAEAPTNSGADEAAMAGMEARYFRAISHATAKLAMSAHVPVPRFADEAALGAIESLAAQMPPCSVKWLDVDGGTASASPLHGLLARLLRLVDHLVGAQQAFARAAELKSRLMLARGDALVGNKPRNAQLGSVRRLRAPRPLRNRRRSSPPAPPRLSPSGYCCALVLARRASSVALRSTAPASLSPKGRARSSVVARCS